MAVFALSIATSLSLIAAFTAMSYLVRRLLYGGCSLRVYYPAGASSHGLAVVGFLVAWIAFLLAQYFPEGKVFLRVAGLTSSFFSSKLAAPAAEFRRRGTWASSVGIIPWRNIVSHAWSAGLPGRRVLRLTADLVDTRVIPAAWFVPRRAAMRRIEVTIEVPEALVPRANAILEEMVGRGDQ